MRLPLITTPLAVMSHGSFFVQGLVGSGRRRVAKIFTTEFSTAFDGVAADEETTAGEGLTSGVGVTGGGLGSAGAASADDATAREKINETRANKTAKWSRKLRWIIRQRNPIRERKRAAFFPNQICRAFLRNAGRPGRRLTQPPYNLITFLARALRQPFDGQRPQLQLE